MGSQSFLRIFEDHGCEFIGERGNQMYGSCPFSGKDDKFYVNKENGLWDSKSAGFSGNVPKFLEMRARNYQTEMTTRKFRQLAEHRQLSPHAFKDWGIGWDDGTSSYTFPIRSNDGTVVDIRRFNLSQGHFRGTAGCRVGLYGAHRLNERPNDPIFLCEGEWDTIALHWLISTLHEHGVVVGVPGAGTFKPDWVHWLSGRTVHTLYDNDPAGRNGEDLATVRLKGSVRKLTYVHWPDEVPVGFDTRDWIVYGTTIRNTPEICWERLKRRFFDLPKATDSTAHFDQSISVKTGKITIRKKKPKATKKWKTPPTLAQVHEIFNKWLFLRNTDVIDVMLATTLSQQIDGSPVWMFIVGPPGSAKTAIISSLQDVEATYTTSTLTAPSLISGASFTGSTDPSLIPRLDGKVLVVKDFTTILSAPDREQKEIFGILRDAYDGRCGKSFGNGIERFYTSRFTILAATTPRVYDLSEQHQALGERFLKFLVGDNLHHESEDEVIKRAIENSDRETVMRTEMTEVVKAYLERTCKGRGVPTLPTHLLRKIVSLAKFGARLRGSVSRDFYRTDIVMSRPMAEVGTRLGQQLAKLARGMAMVYGRSEVTDIEYTLIKKVMLDTISQRNEDVLRAMITAMGGATAMTPMSMRELASKTHYPFATIQRLMQDLAALQIIKRHGSGSATTWTISDYVQKEVHDSGLYTSDELNRPTSGRIRLKQTRVKPAVRSIRASVNGHVPNGLTPVILPPTGVPLARPPAPVPGPKLGFRSALKPN